MDPFIALVSNFIGPDGLLLLIIISAFGFTTWMVVDCINHESSVENSKLIWLLVILLAPLGSLIYFFARKLQRPSAPPNG